MDQTKKKQIRTSYLRRKLFPAAAMLLIASLLMVSTGYAWLVLSTAPEVTGVTTNIGANGSLEIALLNTQSYSDSTLISSAQMGGSMELTNLSTANATWGNLIDLSDRSYGLDKIPLMPARLNYSGDGKVSAGLLSIPTYGYDGRIASLNANTSTTVYDGSGFMYDSMRQQYGVRAIGAVADLNSASAILAQAKANIPLYATTARNNATATFNTYGGDLVGIMINQKINSNASFGNSDLASLKGLANGLSASLGNIEMAIRYGILAQAAATDPENFAVIRDYILNTSNSLNTIQTEYAPFIPSGASEWITKLTESSNNVNSAINSCNALTGGSYSWDQLKPILEKLVNTDRVFINDQKLDQIDSSSLMGSSLIILTMAPGSGVAADIADFAGDYTADVSYLIYNVQINTKTTTNPTILSNLSEITNRLDGAAGNNSFTSELTDICGYALDLAFRCNAETTDLLLQTNPAQRVYADSESTYTQGGGSYMLFSTKDSHITATQIIQLMDAVRVGFVDPSGEILGIAKLNTSNRILNEDGSIKASLYLYEYEIAEDCKMTMGERIVGDNALTTLNHNIVKTVTVVVWLDGDLVDNTMFTNDAENSMKGILNLQFASSVELNPANNAELFNSNVKISHLDELLNSESIQETLDAGQGLYSDLSWNAFISAHEYAQKVNDAYNENPTSVSIGQITGAYNDLVQTKTALQLVSHDALLAKINEVRVLMGKTEEYAGFASDIGELERAYSQEQIDAALENHRVIYRVDDEKNLHEEGNGIKSHIYKVESWNTLALALYNAEAMNLNVEATQAQLNAQLNALDLALSTLDRAVYYIAHDYNGYIYYRAISDDPDSYGKWYDANFQRVVADLMILKLDADAVPAKVAFIEAGTFYNIDSDIELMPYISLNDRYYTALEGDRVAGVLWTISGALDMNTSSTQEEKLQALIEKAEALKLAEYENKVDLSVQIDMATKIINGEKFKHGDETFDRRNTEAETDEFIRVFALAIADEEAKFQTQEENDRFYINADEKLVLTAAIQELQRITDLLSDRLDEAALEKTNSENQKTEAEKNSEANQELIASLTEQIRTLEDEISSLNTKIEELQGKIDSAQGVLNQGDMATKEEVNDQIITLNAAITAEGGAAKTAYNTLICKLPAQFATEYVNPVVLPSMSATLEEYGTIGDVNLSAVILTRNGVLYTATKTVKAFRQYDTVEITQNGTEVTTAPSVTEATIFGFHFVEKVIEGTDESLESNEWAETYTWSIDNTEIATIEFIGNGCTITPIEGKSGTITLTFSVEMDTGSVYTDSITITVEGPALPEPEAPADPEAPAAPESN